MSWTWDSDEDGVPVSSDLYKHMLQVPPLQSIDDWYVWSLEMSTMLQCFGFSAFLPGQTADSCHQDWGEAKKERWQKAQRLMCKLLRQRLEEALYEYDTEKSRSVADIWTNLDKQYRSTTQDRTDALMERYVALDLEQCEGNFSRLLEELDLLWNEMQYLKVDPMFSDSMKIEKLLRCLDPPMPDFREEFLSQYSLKRDGSGAVHQAEQGRASAKGNVNYASFLAIAEFALSVHREGEAERNKKIAGRKGRGRSRSRMTGRKRIRGHKLR